MKKVILLAAVLSIAFNGFCDITVKYKHEAVIPRTGKEVTLVAFPDQPANRKEYKVPATATGSVTIKCTKEQAAKGVNVVTLDQEANASAKIRVSDGNTVHFRTEKATIGEVSANLSEKP